MTVSLDATDESSGVGLTEYMVNGSEWSTYVDQFGLSDDGIHTLEYRSADIAGNLESTWSTTVKVDRTAPALTIGLEDGAVLDRILHHGITVNVKGESYRLQARKRAGVPYPPPAKEVGKAK